MNEKNIILKSIFILIAFFITIFLLGGLNYLFNYNTAKKMGLLYFELDFIYFFIKFMLMVLISGSFVWLCMFLFRKFFEKIFK